MKSKNIFQSMLLLLCLFASSSANAQSPGYPACYSNYSSIKPILVTDNPAAYGGAPFLFNYTSQIAASYGAFPTGLVFFFDGTINVDATVTFQNCTILMSPKTVIKMQSSKNLTFVQCTLQAACNEMWQGVDNYVSSANVYFRQCTVSDMDLGARMGDLSQTSRLDASDNNFYNNWQSLTIGKTSSTYAGMIQNNNFATTSAGLLPPHSGAIGSRAIQILDCQRSSVGNSLVSTTFNNFNRLNCGIYIFQEQDLAAVHNIVNANMTDITGATVINPFTEINGSGIYGYASQANTTVNIWGFSTGSSVFTHTNKGIVLDNFITNIDHVNVSNAAYGIALNRDNNRHRVEICGLEDVFCGIYVTATPATNSTYNNNGISCKNIINTPLYGPGTPNFSYPVGIDLQQVGGTNSVIVRKNTISMSAKGGLGIRVLNPGSGTVTDLNNIFIGAPTALGAGSLTYRLAGIYSNGGSPASQILGNTVTGSANVYYTNGIFPPTNTTVTEPAGILLDASNPLFQCNRLNNTRYGVMTKGYCNMSTTKFADNRFNGNAVDIMMKPTGTNIGLGAAIGLPSADNNNKFNGTVYDQDAGFNVKIYIMDNSTTTRFLRTSNGTITNFESRASNPVARYVPNPASNPFECQAPYNFRTVNPEESTADADEIAGMEAIANGQNEAYNQPGSRSWVLAKQTYDALQERPDLIAASAVLDSFYNSLQGTAIAQIWAAEHAYYALADSVNHTDSVTYAIAVSAVQNAILAITPTNTYEQHYADILPLLLTNLQYGGAAFTTAEQATISNLAHSCPDAEGTAVYIARYLYRAAIAQEDFDDDQLCDPANINTIRMSNSQTAGLRIYPNPANHTVTISGMNSEEAGIFTLYSITGQVVKTVTVTPATPALDIDVTGLQNGMYYYSYTVNGKTKNTGKIIVSH